MLLFILTVLYIMLNSALIKHYLANFITILSSSSFSTIAFFIDFITLDINIISLFLLNLLIMG